MNKLNSIQKPLKILFYLIPTILIGSCGFRILFLFFAHLLCKLIPKFFLYLVQYFFNILLFVFWINQ